MWSRGGGGGGLACGEDQILNTVGPDSARTGKRFLPLMSKFGSVHQGAVGPSEAALVGGCVLRPACTASDPGDSA
eukprot:scaffold67628_cov73-Phaeocystis_antarctica.AAC.2